MYFLPFCSCPSYQFCLFMFCQDILVTLFQFSSVSLLLPWFQSHPQCSTLFFFFFFASLPERKRWFTRCVIAVSHCRLKTCIPGFYYKRAIWSAGKTECSDSVALSLASFSLGRKVVLPPALYQDMAHPQCQATWGTALWIKCCIEAPCPGGWWPSGSGNIPEKDFFFNSKE